MSADPGKPTLMTAILQGPPGAGKSSFIRHYAHKWSTPTEVEELEEQKMWDLIVILQVSTLRVSEGKSAKEQILQAIEQSLTGPEVDAVVEYLGSRNMCLRVLIIPDGLDECRDYTTLQMLKELILQSHKNILPFSVFTTCRSGQCPIKLAYFERRMKIEGFTLNQGKEYVNKYYMEIEKPEDDCVIEYIMITKRKLDHILKNPLRTHILSVVTSDGTLKLSKEHILRLKDLLKSSEKSIKKRQLLKERKSQHNTGKESEKMDVEVQTMRFYMISLYSLLNDIRAFDDSLLQKFEICKRNPYFAFMRMNRSYNDDFENVMVWQFTHEMFHEYFASCAIESLPMDTLKYFLLHLCYRSEFRNTQRILFSTFGEDPSDSSLLINMVQATLLLQSQETESPLPEWISDIQTRVKTFIQNKDPLKILLPEEQHQVTKDIADDATISALWNDITLSFSTNADKSRKDELFLQMLDQDDLLSHVHECLREVSEENQKVVFDSCIGQLLPCEE